MAREPRTPVAEGDIRGLKYFKILNPILDRIHSDGTGRDRAGNRQLFFDQYASLILLYYFTPVITGLRGIQQASQLEKVQEKLGIKPTSLGSLSEAAGVFDPGLLREVLGELARKAVPPVTGREAEALRGLTAVDGTPLAALPRMAWALWLDDRNRAVKVHLHFDVLKGVPEDATLTAGCASETAQLRAGLKPDRLYVVDRGYADYTLFREILDAGSGFVGRLKSSAVTHPEQEFPLSDAARRAGVTADRTALLGGTASGMALQDPVRIAEFRTGKLDDRGKPEVFRPVTNRLDLDADLVALAYFYRWQIELFFRWFKCVLGCKHLLSTRPGGIAIQVYLGLIASLLITLATGAKPAKRTWEMLQFHFAGWATAEELDAHLADLEKKRRGALAKSKTRPA